MLCFSNSSEGLADESDAGWLVNRGKEVVFEIEVVGDP